jgi:hypothetical protein
MIAFSAPLHLISRDPAGEIQDIQLRKDIFIVGISILGFGSALFMSAAPVEPLPNVRQLFMKNGDGVNHEKV